MTEGETGDLALKQVKLTAACHSRTKEWKVRLGRSSRRWSYLVISLIQLNWRSLILPSHGILSCVQLWQTFEFLQGRKKLHDLSWRTRKRGEGGSFPSVARLGRRLRKRRIEEGTQRGRQIVRKRERLKEGKKKSVIHSNTSSSLFAGLRLATGASTSPLQRDGFVISLPSSIRQLPDPTSGQLGREGRTEGRESESEVGENSFCGQKHQRWLPVELVYRQKRQEARERVSFLNNRHRGPDGPKRRRNYGN